MLSGLSPSRLRVFGGLRGSSHEWDSYTDTYQLCDIQVFVTKLVILHSLISETFFKFFLR